MIKINVVTYCTYTSLGSILQAYSLQRKLHSNRCNSSILMYEDENQFNLIKVSSVKSLCKSIFQKVILHKVKAAYVKRTKFIENNINIEYFKNYNEFVHRAENDNGEIYLSGSDQVWQPDNCSPVFFLDFVKNSRCISYAASMGKTEIDDSKKELFCKYLNNFDYISVREEESAEVVRQLTEKEVEVHIDPTFLVSAKEWRDLSSQYNIKKPYILLYMLYWDKSCKEKIKELKKRTGLKVYAIADNLSNVYADKILYDVGVEEFLWLVDNAEYVVTSSFHGTAFSVIFNKRFSAIINPKAPSRITNLLRKLELPNVDIIDLPNSNEFNYQKTNRLIEEEKEKSSEYLKRVTE